ncbi:MULTISPECIES: hypothetical protein [Hyphobacterium]|uniref:DUF4157 domain-containing protein n=1 Tax=Hyphobacterium vulgare TaxID=1736751 RepID=A0ABV6ZTU5_9PROT
MRLFLTGLMASAAAAAFSATADAADYVFATPDEAYAILSADDEFTLRLQPMEIGLRLADNAQTSREALNALYRDSVRNFTDEERARLEALLAEDAALLDSLSPLLPDDVLFIATNGGLDGGFPHTRGNAIVFTPGWLAGGDAGFRQTFYHELWHVLSRHNRDRADEIFGLIGFEPCEVILPESLSERRLTNPDAPFNAHYAPLEMDQADGVVPVLFLPEGGYDPALEGGFGAHLGFALMAVDAVDGTCRAATDADGNPMLIAPGNLPQYLDLIGRNTGYIIHPEETLADNFVLWVNGAEGVPDPEVVERLGAWIEANR